MNILVTGGAGFIGSRVACKLSNLGHNVSVLDNLDPYYQLRLKRYNLQKLRQKNINFFNIDIRDAPNLEEVIITKKPEVVIHLAAKAGVRNSIVKPQQYFYVNVEGTLNVLQISKLQGVKKVMIASSSSVYGNNKVPFSEDDPVENPISPYAASKRAMEILCKMYSQTYNINIQVFRLFTVYGPSGRPDMAPAIFTRTISNRKPIQVFGSLDIERDYTYIDDVVDGFIKAIAVNDKFSIYNLGNNKPIKLGEFITTIEKTLNRKASIELLPPFPGDVQKTWASISKAKRAFNYNPETSIEEGMSKFISWYKKNKNLYA